MPSDDVGEEDPPGRKHERYRYKNKRPAIAGLSAFINTYRNEQKANRKQEKREDNTKKWLEIWTLIFVILTFFGIAVQDGILQTTMQEARVTAETQHSDTLQALAKADAANSLAKDIADRQLKIMQGQLEEMRDEQMPIIWVGKNLGTPEFYRNEKTGMIQVLWSFHFTNDGKGFVTHGTHETFIRVGTGEFVKSYGQPDINRLTPIAPTDDQFLTVISAPMSPDYVDSISKTERAFSIMAKFTYFGADDKPHETAICLTKLLAGAIQFCDGGYVK